MFGLDAFSLDDRLRLFGYVHGENRNAYLWTLRAFDRARAGYRVLLHTNEAAEVIGELHREHPATCPDPAALDLNALLDALVRWGVLDRSQDGTAATTLQEYRFRNAVYQFTEAGYVAHRAVEGVLSASLAETSLSRLVFADILADLKALAKANENADSEEVYRKLSRLDRVLADMAERAARFYLMLGDLGRSNDARPQLFLAHKDALLSHLNDFHEELMRYSPLLSVAVRDVEATGRDSLIERAAEADERIFRTPSEREEDWRQRWAGLRSWFASSTVDDVSEADRMSTATMDAVTSVLTLLRRLTDARKSAVSRESQLRHLATWFMATPSESAAHALFDAVFGLGSPRHVGVTHAVPESIPSRRSFWDAPAVELERSLVETGRAGSPGPPHQVKRDEAGRSRLRERQLTDAKMLMKAAQALAAQGVHGPVLDEAQTELLLRLLDLALTARIPAAGLTTAAAHGVKLTLVPCPGTSTVRTSAGDLHISGYRLEVAG